MTTRDHDIDNLLDELKRPYIEKPDEVQTDVGGACFLNRQRVCGPDCTAFIEPQAPTAVERCALLSTATTAVELLGELVQLSRKPVSATASAHPPPFDRRHTK